MKKLILITGTGRSGTSTMSGTLHHLGLYVPGPHLGANESNPKGFFESKWAVRFHKRLLTAAGVDAFDARPSALDRAQQAITPERRRTLVRFLTEHSADHDQIVIKDPRSVWVQRLWGEAAAEAGLDIGYIAMLRHPAEVIGSRATYYASPIDQSKRRSYEITSVARWVNSSLITERETRGQVRAFVSYPALVSDWRPVLARLAGDLGLSFDVDPASTKPCAVDDFIDPGLRRHRVQWDELDVPAELKDVAQRVWDDLELLADRHGGDEAASADLDAQSHHYERIFAQATAIAHDVIADARREARSEHIGQPPSGAAEAAPVPEEDTLTGGGVAGHDLLRMIGGRVRGRLGRGAAGR